MNSAACGSSVLVEGENRRRWTTAHRHPRHWLRRGKAWTGEAWIDTGFTGDLVLPLAVIGDLALTTAYRLSVRLADGTVSEVDSYEAKLDWFGRQRSVEVVAGDAALPLVGINLLLGLELIADYRNLQLSLSPKPKMKT